MVLGWRGPRSTGMRITAGVALAATLVGPLRMAYGNPASPASTPQPVGGTQAAAAHAKLPTDVPWALSTAVRPVRIKVLGGAADEAEVWRLFDGLAATGLTTDGRPSRFRLELPQPTYLDAVAVFGRVAGTLSVETEGASGATPLLQKAALSGGGARWNRRDFAKAPLVTAVIVTFEPGAPDAMLPEIELWGRPVSVPSAVATATLPDALYSGVPSGAR
jgi:hypothetical protein